MSRLPITQIERLRQTLSIHEMLNAYSAHVANLEAENKTLIKERDAATRRADALQARVSHLERLSTRLRALCNRVKPALRRMLTEAQLYNFSVITEWSLDVLLNPDHADFYEVTQDGALSALHTGDISVDTAAYLLGVDVPAVRRALADWRRENGRGL